MEAAVLLPLKEPGRFRQLGGEAPAGVLLWGPSGCGKSALALALAGRAQANFLSVSAGELRSKVVGDSERRLHRLFLQARSAAPCILLLDQVLPNSEKHIH
jgi:ribosome biogenesis ATPase